MISPNNDRSANTIHVVQGDFVVTEVPGVMLTTVLGSCVAVCLRDSKIGLGGMNHFLLPGGERSDGMVMHGVNAMELLINALLKRGANRNRFEAKVFGGASVIDVSTDIGPRNGEFALEFLEAEGIPCLSRSLGGNQARRVQYWPETGRARQKQLAPAETPKLVETPPPAPKPAPATDDGDDLELF